MDQKEEQIPLKEELDDEDKIHITEVFREDVAPQLMRMHARIGNINCEFAGKEYRNWVIEFKSSRFGFEIVDFVYDENSRSFHLSPRPMIDEQLEIITVPKKN